VANLDGDAVIILDAVRTRVEIPRNELAVLVGGSDKRLERALQVLQDRENVIVLLDIQDRDRVLVRFSTPKPDHDELLAQALRINWT
jgi:hypothetical protein